MANSKSLKGLFRSLIVSVGVVFGATGGLGCAGETDATESAESAVGRRPVDLVERFPVRESIDFAMSEYSKHGRGARARDPVSVGHFYGKNVQSANIGNLRVEMLKPNPRYGDKPIAFLWTQFHGGDGYWNNRYKDVQLRRLVEATGAPKNPFPEAVYVKHEGSSLLRLWTDYRTVKEGAPPELTGNALKAELARILVWSYVSGNADGPAHNGSNGGFARFRDQSGREFWEGVLIDAGAAWNNPGKAQQPWNTNVLGQGPVRREHIPTDVVNSVTQIARRSAEELAKMSGFETVDAGALEVVRGIRERARTVLSHYELPY